MQSSCCLLRAAFCCSSAGRKTNNPQLLQIQIQETTAPPFKIKTCPILQVLDSTARQVTRTARPPRLAARLVPPGAGAGQRNHSLLLLLLLQHLRYLSLGEGVNLSREKGSEGKKLQQKQPSGGTGGVCGAGTVALGTEGDTGCASPALPALAQGTNPSGLMHCLFLIKQAAGKYNIFLQ